MGSKRSSIILLIVISLVALVIRFYDISTNPPELFSDEAIGITSAKSIIEHGYDLEGRNILYFSDRLELRAPVYGYFAYFTSKIIGWNVLAVRLPAIIGGLILVISVFVIGKYLYSDLVGIVASFIVATIPWAVQYSRIGWEPGIYLPLLTVGITLFIVSCKTKRVSLLVISLFFFVLSAYSYNSAIVTVIFFIFILSFTNWTFLRTRKKLLIMYIVFFLLCCTPIIDLSMREPKMLERTKSISTFASGVNSATVKIFAKNYFMHFNWWYLTQVGDMNRRQGSGQGLMYPWIVLAAIIGLYSLWKRKNYSLFLFFVLWTLYYPIGGSVTNDGVPHATRTLIGLPLFSILGGVGLVAVFELIQNKFSKKLAIYTMLIFVFFASYEDLNFLKSYYRDYPAYSAGWWEYGNKNVFKKIYEIGKDTDVFCLGNLNYWNAEGLIAFYKKQNSPLLIEGTKDSRCTQTGAIQIVPIDKLTTGQVIAITPDFNSQPQYYFVRITKSDQ